MKVLNLKMALNPPLNTKFIPLRVYKEHFIMEIEGVEFEIKIENIGKLKGKSKALITSSRLVLINSDNKGGSLKAFDLPLALIYGEKFVQPIFNFNFLEGKCLPLIPNSFKGEIFFKLRFKYECGTFMKVWNFCLL